MLAAIAVLAALSLLVTLVSYGAVFRKLRQRHDAPNVRPGITILKPLKGDDDELYENLVAFAKLDYANYEVLFGAEDPDDPALDVARRVQREFPERRLRVIVGARSLGLNPKVRLLARLAEFAAHDWILISDSNVRPRTSYLRELMACQERTGAALVHSLLCGVGERSAGAILENLQMNSWVVSAVSLADAAGHPCVIGKSMLMRRSTLAKLGGFDGVRDLLAEDYALGELFDRAGLRVVLSPHVLPVYATERSVASFVNRHMRWGQLRRRISPRSYACELLLHPLPSVAALVIGGPRELVLWALGGYGIKLLADAYLSSRLRGHFLVPSQWLWIPLKDAMILGMSLVALFRTRVNWRGNQMRIGPQSRLVPIEVELEPAHSEA
jgi:ceramide glucosyltransferase